MAEKPGPGVSRVAVIMGGVSAEREVSVNTGRTVVRELRASYRVKPVEILANGRWRVSRGFLDAGQPEAPEGWFGPEALPLLEALGCLVEERVDVAFNALHGPVGEDGTVQGLFRMLSLPLTGPDVIPAAVTMDKRLTKQVLMAASLPTPRFFSIRGADLERGAVDWREVVERELPRLAFPWVLKPNRLGSSVGVGIFQDPEHFLHGVARLLASWPESSRGDDLLVEEGVSGRELTCGVLETGGMPLPLPPIEIRPRAREFFDYHAKYTPGASEEICPAPLAAAETSAVQSLAVSVHRLLECAPLSRTDMFLTPGGELTVLEINTLPGMTATSLIPLAAARKGIPLAELLGAIVEHAARRGN